MKNRLKNLSEKILKRKWTVGVVGIVLLGLAWIIFGRSPTQATYETIIVGKHDLVQEVSVTGTVQSVQEIDLSFESAGKVGTVYVKLGDTVKSGQILAALDNGTAYSQLSRAQAGVSGAVAQLKQYQAGLDAEIARLDSLKKGSSSEEVDVAIVTVQNAERSLADAQNNLTVVNSKAEVDMKNLIDGIPALIYESYAVTDEAVRIQTDPLFNNERNDAELTFQVTEYQTMVDAERLRDQTEKELVNWQASLTSIPTGSDELEAELDVLVNHLDLARTFLMSAMDALNYSAGLSSTTLATYQSAVNTARTSVNSEIEAITTQKQALAALRANNESAINTATSQVNTVQNTLSSARSQLALAEVGATDEAIRIQQASIDSAEANLEIQESRIAQARADLTYYQSLYNQSLIRAPFAGIVTLQDAKVGAMASPNSPVIGLLSEAEFEMEAKVPEADIAKLELGMTAKVTLDAYGSDKNFDATVVFIDRGETVVDGVSTYLVKFQFNEESELIKSGMTANIDIAGATRDQVIAIPQRAIIRSEGRRFVQVLKDGIVTEVEVTTGLRASDGSIEISSGLNEGDEVVLYTE